MRSFLFIITAISVIGLAFWAYHENYKTQEALGKTESLQREIGAARQRLTMLRAEWAYLNRPDRLRELADLNFETLGLLTFAPEQFGRVDEVPFPSEENLITEPIEVSVSVPDSAPEGNP